MNFFTFFRHIAGKRFVFFELVSREVAGRYSGSSLGILWSFVTPVLMLGVYTIAFRQILGMRWPDADNGADFSLMIFSGMIVHTLFAECLLRSPSVIIANSNLVKRVVFPLALLPCVVVASAVFNAVLSLIAMLIFIAISRGSIPWTVFFIPVLFIPYLVLLCGISWLLASLGVFFRDISQLMGTLSTILMFLSPVFYPISSLHEPYRSLVSYNPLTFVIEQLRDLLLHQHSLDWTGLAAYWVMATAILFMGYWWFQKTRDGFADVL